MRVNSRFVEFHEEDGLYYYQGKPFTGEAFTLSKDGWERSQRTFRDGMLWGPTRDWYAPGVPMTDSNFLKGALHGRARDWHKDGSLAEDGEYEHGITIWSKQWDEKGQITRDYRLKETDDNYQRLLRYREVMGPADQ